ncbi:MAG TPA: SNF2-related protein, partial [Tepidisphaeraceae bacterium]
MLIGVWDTTHLLLFGIHAHDDLRPVEVARLPELLSKAAPDAVPPATAEIVDLQLHMPGLGEVTAPAWRFTAAEAYDLLTAVTVERTEAHSDSLIAWVTLARLVQGCMAAQQIYPTLREVDGVYVAQWHPLVGGREEMSRLDRFAHALPAVCRALPHTAAIEPLRLVESFLTRLTDALVRRAVASDEFFARVHNRPAAIDVRWLSALLGASDRIEADPRELQQLYGDVHLWLMPITDAGQQIETKLGLHLREPAGDSTLWPVDFRLVSTEDATTIVTAADLWRQKGSPLTATGRMILERQEKVITELRRGVGHFPSLERALATPYPAGIELTPTEAFAFMRSWSHGMVEDGFDVELPDWAAPQDSELSLQLEIAPEDDDETLDMPRNGAAGGGQPMTAGGRIGLDALVRFDWRIAIGQQEVTIAEFEQLLAQQSPLVRFKDKWVQIDLDAAKKAQETIARNKTGRLTLGEAFRAAYGLAGDNGVPVGGLSGADWIGQLLSQVPDPNMQQLAQPESFLGELRPYQLRGLQWMAYLDRLGLGACLADDMGLGKTIQFIALLLQEREAAAAATERLNGHVHADADHPAEANGSITNGVPAPATASEKRVGPTLLFAPASVLGNWTRELQKFAPNLKVLSHHGPARAHGEAFVAAAMAHDVVLTGYTLAHRDAVDFKQVRWHRIALDEAQKVKNSASAASVAIRSFPARRCVALTGTPI